MRDHQRFTPPESENTPDDLPSSPEQESSPGHALGAGISPDDMSKSLE